MTSTTKSRRATYSRQKFRPGEAVRVHRYTRKGDTAWAMRGHHGVVLRQRKRMVTVEFKSMGITSQFLAGELRRVVRP